MNKKLLSLLFITPFLFSSCTNGLKNEKAYKAINNLDNIEIKIDSVSLKYMVNHKYSFPVLLYTEDCSYCSKARDNLAAYNQERPYGVYTIEMNSSVLSELTSFNKELFPTNMSFPVMYNFNNGELTYSIGPTDLIDYRSFDNKLTAQLLDSNISTFTTTETFNSYNIKQDSFLLYIYNSSNNSNNTIYEDKIYPLAKDSNKNTLILDEKYCNSALLSKISLLYNLDKLDVLAIIENRQKKTAIKYDTASGNSIDNLLNSFFNSNSNSGSF